MLLKTNKVKNNHHRRIESRDVLLTPQELIEHAKTIAKNHTVSHDGPSLRYLLKRLDENFQRISLVYQSLNEGLQHQKDLSPASEWLLDNFYKVEEQVKEVRQNLFKEKSLRLYTLDQGPFKGYPRAYSIALEFIAHTDGKLEERLFIDFIEAYQSQRVLTIAEIWSLSLMIRCGLIENIRRVCERIYNHHKEWQKVEEIKASTVEEILESINKNIELEGRGNAAFIQHLLRLLRREDREAGEIITYLEKKLKDYNTSIKDLIEEEHKEQAEEKMAIGNSITSLNIVATIDWNDIFEGLSIVEKILREDPSGIYPQLDFESRDYYRRHVEKIARKLKVPEARVARKGIEEARKAKEGDKRSHVGYYLIDKGRSRLFEALGYPAEGDTLKAKTLSTYLGPIFIITAIVVLMGLLYGQQFIAGRKVVPLLTIGLVVLLPTSDIAVSLTNWILTHVYPPSFLPRIEYREGLPKEVATMVVIPTLLPNEKRVKEMVHQMEVAYLANQEENLLFALVGDFKDADQKERPEDKKIINTGVTEIKSLNEKYGKDIFYFFIRERRYNKKQEKWMGWERKRGALVELNQLILGSKETSYIIQSGDISKLKGLKYLLTIDADTKLPIDTAKKLIGIASHPLNTPVIDEKTGIVLEGYGLIQPRIGVNLESTNKSFFTKIFAGEGGIDSYTIANSDVYQDLFGRGIFTGKGIYDIQVFDKVLKDAIPEDTILSHDLLEGSYIRTGLATDIELIDHYPSSYSAYIMRLHRWVRGDWQLIKWLYDREKKPLPALAKWQILDNMRRSLVPISLLVLFVLGLTSLPGSPVFWIVLGVLTITIPLLISIITYIKERYYKAINERLHEDLAVGVKASLYQAWLNFVFLPYQAYVMTDAILRTLYRVYFSKRNLLEWITAADVEKNLKNDKKAFIHRMKSSIIVGVFIFLFTLFIEPYRLFFAVPIAIIWGLGPFIAFDISKESLDKGEKLEDIEIQGLRRIARKTWAYYEDFAGEDNNYLPPDNYQVDPPKGIAHRTSPTNIGFLLMGILTARDLGYLPTGEMLRRMEKTIRTIEKMDKWKGHLYNWYDTRTLEVLRPYYVSTVDSGNFVSYLITVKEGLKNYLEKPPLDSGLFMGLKDTMDLMQEVDKKTRGYIEELLKNEEVTIEEYMDTIIHLQREIYTGEINCGWHRRFFDMLSFLQREIEMYYPSQETIKEQKLHLNNKSLLELKEIYNKILVKRRGKVNQAVEQELLEKIHNIDQTIEGIYQLIKEIEEIVEATEFTHLYDKKRHLFSIGYNVEEERLTHSYYDLMASEVRTTSYLAIVRREVPQKHWFKLGRAMTMVEGHRGLVSWTGTMFEYFMPYLVMKNYKSTLVNETYHTVIEAQKNYCEKKGVPWGISESGYYAFDMALNYQYRAFGIPDLGLKRGLGRDIVVSPYSSFLALPFKPREAMENIQKLIQEGLEGEYGFYEAIDYTPRPVSQNFDFEIVKSFMAHHQGMIFVAINNFLNHNIMQKRFHQDPLMEAGEMLLQERIPRRLLITKQHKEAEEPLSRKKERSQRLVRTYGATEGLLPQCHFLSNGRYSVMVTNLGTGYSKIENLQVTRWREDAITGRDGTHIFLRHLEKEKLWTTSVAPFFNKADSYQVRFSQDKAEFLRSDDGIDTRTEIVVSPEDDVEIRRVTLTNHSNMAASIELTSYFEVVLAQQAADLAHPAFSNLFVRTESLLEEDSIIASRKPREHGQETKWLFHRATVEGEVIGGLQFETNRGEFIGRGRDISNPIALTKPLHGTEGVVLDPIMSIRKTLKVPAGKSATITFVTGIHYSREGIVELVKKYGDATAIQRAFQLAITRSQVEDSYLDLKEEELKIYQEMLSQIIFLSPLRRKYQDLLKENTKSQSGLWAYGISGDLPILLVSIRSTEGIDVIRQLLKAHEYWRLKGLAVDLVILNEDESNYLQPLQQLIHDTVFSSQGRSMVDQPGGIFIRNANAIPPEDRRLLYTVARIIIKAEGDSLRKQIQLPEGMTVGAEKVFANKTKKYTSRDEPLDLKLHNGYGGFSKDGREYIIELKENLYTPAPWINVVANKDFGFIVSERGSSFTWAENSRENKLTPWSNDPVTDPSGEIIYIRDEETGEVWSPTPYPIRRRESYTIAHGLGYSTFLHNSQGIQQWLTVFVPEKDPIKINLLRIKNNSDEKRSLSLTYYIRPVLGVNEDVTQQYIITERQDKEAGIFIKNPYNSDFEGRIAFVDTSEEITSFTCDRQEFIGLQGSLLHPDALKREKLSNRFGGGYDPCVAIQIHVEIKGYEEKEVVFLFGQAKGYEEVQRLLSLYKNKENCRRALEEVKNYWLQLVNTLQVKTPDLSMDLMLNQWLPYQTLCCRMWARSAFYQSGGAYGYRDQLQDAMNMVYPLAEATRQQILLHCRHQFVEGDVQHWWHPGAGDKGIRTRFSDDLLWLPYAVVEYIHNTGDYSILEEEVEFLEEEPLKENEDERYGIPRISQEKASVYEHCIRAIDRGLKFGENGIPLMGSGDWNDGMNTVGNKGKGESVWLGWFLYSILMGFAALCERMEENQRGKEYIAYAHKIAEAIEKNAWDGGWYLRAFYDDGSPLGSRENTECKIDSLAQSWSVISGGGKKDRRQKAMEAVEQYLVRRDEGMILLFTPPFDKSHQNPGYIKGYVPGVRENGGQYTHAATWVIKAFAMEGDGDKAWELFHMINPINHTRTPLECATYKLEPYVMAADVYAVSPHVGRGGWSWYTGVAGWMYKVGVEDILGLKKNADRLVIDPCIPKDWKEYSLQYRYGNTYYRIRVINPNGVNSGVKKLFLDGKPQFGGFIPLTDDGKEHEVEVVL